jgi:hypothetical protein
MEQEKVIEQLKEQETSIAGSLENSSDPDPPSARPEQSVQDSQINDDTS